ncbi:uncharacterized protein LOC130260420 isoform X14 [Oenanthe melanoleuca]|uniref:uncharacterized protein LOC130260420 isoform X14 n=1 Tax=Oenanthe melanoleuca TaxID=2939378 RepID=UPI0024C1FD0B|nr:uncharacterized protein LOC130260420 isoform X14 [Oenanthe melanoleuca]
MAAESSALKPPCRRFPSVFPQTHLACCPVPCSGEFVHQWSFQVLQQGLECRDCSCRAQRVTEGLCCSQGWSAGIAPAGSRGAQRVTSGSVLQPGLECRDCSCRAQRVTSGSVLQPGLECRDCSCRAQRDTEGHIRVCAAARVGVQGLLLQGAEGHIRVCAAARVGVQGLLLQGTEGHIRVCAAARVGVQGLLLQGAEGHIRVCAAARVGVQGLLLQGTEGHRGSVLQPGLECRDCSCREQRVTSGSVLQPPGTSLVSLWEELWQGSELLSDTSNSSTAQCSTPISPTKGIFGVAKSRVRSVVLYSWYS